MPLKFPATWRFESPGPLPQGVSRDFSDLIGKITTQGDAWSILEDFKGHFASAAGYAASGSSSMSWAQSDLDSAMGHAQENAPLFIEAFYNGCEEQRKAGLGVPDVAFINRILAKHDAGFEIRPPDLVALKQFEVPQPPPTLSEAVPYVPRRAVTERLNWSAITDEQFERLMFTLIGETYGYENPQWLQQTNAVDRGRDLSVVKIENDPLGGVRRHRIIVQCKHWLSRSVGIAEVSNLRAQMELWTPPRVDGLILATTGRFTADAIAFIERHNQEDRALHISMWADSHLEMLLAARPHLIGHFNLR
jgi:hypothetical protein